MKMFIECLRNIVLASLLLISGGSVLAAGSGDEVKVVTISTRGWKKPPTCCAM